MAENIDNFHLGGYDVEFITKPMINVCCPICVLTMKSPVQTLPCSHQFCEDCITRHKDSSAGPQHRCPVCNGEIENWFPDGAVKRMILDLLIKCQNHNQGCLDTFEMRSLNEHLLTCGYQEIQCTIANCEIKVQRRYLENHLAECTNRTVRCEYCDDRYVFKNKQIHEVDCKRFPEQCTNNCGKIVARKEMTTHLEDVCPKTIHDCKYLNIIGCKVQGTRKELAEHMENHIKQHLSLAIDEINDVKENMSREIKKLKDGKEKMSREFQELKDLMTRKCDFLYNSTLKRTLLNRVSVEVRNFAVERKQIKDTGLKKNFDSDEFFCYDGYQAKLRVSIQPRLDNILYTAAYFVLIKGPYDDHLEWPFVGKIKFSFTGSNMQSTIKIISTSELTPEDIEECFNKPISENLGYGWILPFSTDDNFYCFKSDTLKIEIDVLLKQ